MLSTFEVELLKEVSQINAIAGHEHHLAKYLENHFRAWGYDIVCDNLGSLFAYKKSKFLNAPRVVVASHMDEIGLSVNGIKDNGLIEVSARGGIDPLIMLSQRVSLTTKDNKILKGVVDALPPHLSGEGKNALSISHLQLDFGFASKAEAVAHGIYIGAMVVMDGEFTVLNDGKRLLAKAFDNRYGVFLALITAYELRDMSLPYDLYIGATVQEEVGLRGATTAAYLLQPDFVFVLDCSPARDTMGKDEEGKLGEGILLRYLDRSMIAFPELLTFQEEMAQKAGVKTQYYSSPGGTDAGAFHLANDGVLTLTHCICARSIHTPGTIVDSDDITAAKISLLVMLNHLDKEKITAFQQARRL